MTVTVDTSTTNVRTGTGSPTTFSHGGAASGVKGFILALVNNGSATDSVSAASYGGTALTRAKIQAETLGEPGAAQLWFLGASVPQGTQTVSYTTGAVGDDYYAEAITLLAAADTEVIDTDGTNGDIENPSLTLNYGGRSSMAFAAMFSGIGIPENFTVNANCTKFNSLGHDFGSQCGFVFRQTTAGTSDFAIGGTSGADDVALAAIAVSEVVAANWTLAVDKADLQPAGSTITLNKTWSDVVTAASLQPAGQTVVFDLKEVVTAAGFSAVGQDVALQQSWSIVVTQADLQPVGQTVGLEQTWSIVVDSTAFQIDGQEVSLVALGDTLFQVDAAAFSIVGSEVEFVLTHTQADVSGGFIEGVSERRRRKELDDIRREIAEEQERAELADRLEAVLIEEGSLSPQQAEMIRLRGLVNQYGYSDLPNRARRAVDYAERAKSTLALELALREIQKAEQEEELALLLLLSIE